jgi:hypothetical protein
MKKILLLLLLISNICFAEEAFIGYGVGVFNDANYYLGQNKYIDAGYRSFIWDGFYWEWDGGYWGEGSPDIGRKSGFFASSGPGLEIDLQPLELRSGWQLAAISNPDSQLGGYFPEFHGTASIGLRDKKGDGIAVEYNHISSAGLVTPNIGRDFILLELSQKW